MSNDSKHEPGRLRKALRLFGIIFLVLLVPMAMREVEIDRETVRLVGRVALGLSVLLLAYGLIKQLMKVLAFVVLALIVTVGLTTEGHVELPRLSQLIRGGE